MCFDMSVSRQVALHGLCLRFWNSNCWFLLVLHIFLPPKKNRWFLLVITLGTFIVSLIVITRGYSPLLLALISLSAEKIRSQKSMVFCLADHGEWRRYHGSNLAIVHNQGIASQVVWLILSVTVSLWPHHFLHCWGW